MANNYQLFSDVIRRLTPEEQTWARLVLGSDQQDQGEHEPASVLKEAGLDVAAIDLDDWPGFQWEITEPECDLWLYAEECGNASHVGEFVRAFLSRFHPQDCWQLTWANTCSRPCIGEFGGGGLFVTARSVRFFDAADWMARQRRAFELRAKAGRT
jgi:hypothetical protein